MFTLRCLSMAQSKESKVRLMDLVWLECVKSWEQRGFSLIPLTKTRPVKAFSVEKEILSPFSKQSRDGTPSTPLSIARPCAKYT